MIKQLEVYLVNANLYDALNESVFRKFPEGTGTITNPANPKDIVSISYFGIEKLIHDHPGLRALMEERGMPPVLFIGKEHSVNWTCFDPETKRYAHNQVHHYHCYIEKDGATVREVAEIINGTGEAQPIIITGPYFYIERLRFLENPFREDSCTLHVLNQQQLDKDKRELTKHYSWKMHTAVSDLFMQRNDLWRALYDHFTGKETAKSPLIPDLDVLNEAEKPGALRERLILAVSHYNFCTGEELTMRDACDKWYQKAGKNIEKNAEKLEGSECETGEDGKDDGLNDSLDDIIGPDEEQEDSDEDN